MLKETLFWLTAVIIATCIVVCSANNEDEQEKFDIINSVNKANLFWKARQNFHPSQTTKNYDVFFGVIKDPSGISLPELEEDDEDDDFDIPESFDSREQWQDCIGLKTVRDQGHCGSCWAVSSTSVFTNRLCIASKGRFNSLLSAQNLLSCCDNCGFGCHGGIMRMAFKYFETSGIVTGGDYNSSEGCQPYTIPNCDHFIAHGKFQQCEYTPEVPTPKCQTTCYNKEYKKFPYKEDRHYFKKDSSFTISNNVKKAQREIMRNGPLMASFEVYEDFVNYTSGVYIHHKSDHVGAHAVEVIGWGEEDNISYWLVANSWNDDWGDKGYFKIRRGTNECKFESGMMGGYPEVD